MKQPNNLPPCRKLSGFSLLELIVVMVLVAGLVSMAILSLNALTGANIKNNITHLAGLTSEIYNKAALSGVTHRINFDLDNNTYWVEEKTGDLGVISPELGYEQLMKDLQDRASSQSHSSEVKQNNTKHSSKNSSIDSDADHKASFAPTFKALSDNLGEKTKLDDNLVIHGAWTEQMPEIARSGIVSIYFFSGGYTQSAFISISKKDEEEQSSMYVLLNPLTGSVEINLGEPDITEILNQESEK